MAFTLGQHTFANPSTGAQSLAYASNVTAGNLLVVASVNFNGAATITTPFANTGTAGVQTWHPLLTTPFQSSAAGSTSQMWWTIASGTGSCTCTITWSVSTFGEIYVSEFSGSSISAALTQDGAGQHSDGTLATINVPSITTTGSDDLIIGYIVGGVTVASPYVQLDTQGGDLFFYRAGVGAGTYPAAGGYATQPSGAYSSVVAALSASAAADAPIPQPLLTLMGVPMFGQQPPLPFGLIPDQPPVQVPSGIWLPATTTPSPRNRSSFFVVRGRQVKAVPNQETPIVERRSPGVRREPPRLSRGARPFPVQPQTAPVSQAASPRRLRVRLLKGRVVTPVPPQATVVLIWVPRQVPGHRRVVLPSRGRVFAPVPPQVVVVSVWVPTFISPNSTFY